MSKRCRRRENIDFSTTIASISTKFWCRNQRVSDTDIMSTSFRQIISHWGRAVNENLPLSIELSRCCGSKAYRLASPRIAPKCWCSDTCINSKYGHRWLTLTWPRYSCQAADTENVTFCDGRLISRLNLTDDVIKLAHFGNTFPLAAFLYPLVMLVAEELEMTRRELSVVRLPNSGPAIL